MHAPLGVPERQQACAEFIAALDRCHSKSMWSRFTAVCNEDKNNLNMCLRKERLERTERNKKAAQERTKKKLEAWEKLEAEKAADLAAAAAAATPERV